MSGVINTLSAGTEFPQSPANLNAWCSQTSFLQPHQDALWSKCYSNAGCWFSLCLSSETTSKKENGCSALVHCYEQHRQDRGRKTKQTAAYPWELCKKRGTWWAFPTARVPATIAKPRQSRRDSSMRSPRVTIHFKVKGGTARILLYCHNWLAERILWVKPECCSHHCQYCLNLQTGMPWGSMAGCVVAH